MRLCVGFSLILDARENHFFPARIRSLGLGGLTMLGLVGQGEAAAGGILWVGSHIAVRFNFNKEIKSQIKIVF